METKQIAKISSGYDAIASVDGLKKYIADVNKIPSLTEEEEFLLAKAYLDKKDPEAAKKLVASHLKLVVKIALGYKNYGLPSADLISEGNIGLMQAVKKYNPDLGFRLSTYAMWWIKASVQDYILKSWSLVKIGTRAAQKKLFFGLAKAKNSIMRAQSREVNQGDYEDIARDMGVTVDDVREMNSRMSRGDLSLNAPVSNSDESGASEMIEFLPEQRESHEIEVIENQETTWQKKLLQDAMQKLTQREQNILASRRLADPAITLDVLSKKHQISKERVRQIENAALKKIRSLITDKVEGLHPSLSLAL